MSVLYKERMGGYPARSSPHHALHDNDAVIKVDAVGNGSQELGAADKKDTPI
jgi:hypothetical protein